MLVLKYRVAVVVITIGLTIFFGYGAAHVTLNTDMLSYLRDNEAGMTVFLSPTLIISPG
jgi:predicted RND superfamily exporter protein